MSGEREENMIKICYVVTIPLTIESFFIPQLQYLASNGFDVTVVCSNDSSLQEKLGESIRFYPIDIPRGISVGGSIYAIKALTHFLRKKNSIWYSIPPLMRHSILPLLLREQIAKCEIIILWVYGT